MDKIQKFWDKQARRYDDGEKQFEPVVKKIISKTTPYLTKNDTVFDYGCATGTKTIELAASAGFMYGIDISPEMINEAVKKLKARNIANAEFASGTIFANPFSNKEFNVIIAYAIVHLLENTEAIINKIHEMLKPGGLFISTTACLKDKMQFKNKMQFLAYSALKKLGIFPLHLNMFTTADVEDLIRAANFEIREHEQLFDGITISFIVAQKK